MKYHGYISNIFDVKYSILGLQKWIHRNKFSYKQLKGVPHNFDQEKQSVFVEEYNELKATLPSDEPIFFMDATHKAQATKVQLWLDTDGNRQANRNDG